MTITEHFEIWDLIKILCAFLTGIILGIEREMKDKAAGLNTITIITLGATLFTMLSYKFSGSGDPTRIASYIVSGIGFWGAGVIFKEGFTVYGLTTPGVIWVAAAIGMGIGFGAYIISACVLIASLIIIYSAKFMNIGILTQHSQKNLLFVIPLKFADRREEILQKVSSFSKNVENLSLEKLDESIIITANVHLQNKNLLPLEDYLLHEPLISNFQI